jgi:aspartate-semialdehyde dehydrogenase
MPDNFRIAIVGAASLRGKELNEALAESSFGTADFVLMDDPEALGKLESVGDEVTFIQQITPTSFAHADFTFFAADPDVTLRHWQTAAAAGSSIVDLSGALEAEAGAVVCAPWLESDGSDTPSFSLDLKTPAVLPAHPAALALALLLSRAKEAGAVRSAFATVLEPASEYGRAAMDELHQQTVSLLSFQSLPKLLYDAQIAFNAIPAAGEEAKIHLRATEERIRRHYALLSAGKLPRVAIQLIHAPVFHGHTFSIGLEFERPVAPEHLQAALETGEHIEITQSDEDAPSNLAAAGQEDILVQVRPADAETGPTTRYWLWAASDNLKLSALNAVACAGEMRRLRPRGQVQ